MYIDFGVQSEGKRETHPTPVATFCLPAILATRHRLLSDNCVFFRSEHLGLSDNPVYIDTYVGQLPLCARALAVPVMQHTAQRSRKNHRTGNNA